MSTALSLRSLCLAASLLVTANAARAQIYTTSDPPQAIPDSTGTFVACQDIVVPPGAGLIADLNVITRIDHSWVGDLTIRLIPPGGTPTLDIMNRPGRSGSGFGRSANFSQATPITWDDQAPSGRSAETVGENPVGTPCGSAAIVGSAGCPPDNYVPAPDPTDTPISGTGTNLGQYNGNPASGTWRLCVADSEGGDTGTLVSWSLVITPLATPPTLSLSPPPGSTITGSGGGFVGSTANFSIAGTITNPGTGTGPGATTTFSCTPPGPPFAGFTGTMQAEGNGPLTGSPITGTCTLGPAPVTVTMTCQLNEGGNITEVTYQLVCPLGIPEPRPVDTLDRLGLALLALVLLALGAVAYRRLS